MQNANTLKYDSFGVHISGANGNIARKSRQSKQERNKSEWSQNEREREREKLILWLCSHIKNRRM